METKQEVSPEEAQVIADDLVSQIVDWGEESSSLFMAMLPKYLAIAEQGNVLTNTLFAKEGEEVLFGIIRDEVIGFVNDYGLNQSALITGNTRKVVRDIIANGLISGEGNKETAKRIEKANPALSKNRARAIADTEVHNSFMYSREANFKAGGIKYWRWLTAGDSKVRPQKGIKNPDANHRILNGQIRLIGTPFVENLKRPGDPDARAAQTIRCRCDIVPATEAEYNAQQRKMFAR